MTRFSRAVTPACLKDHHLDRRLCYAEQGHSGWYVDFAIVPMTVNSLFFQVEAAGFYSQPSTRYDDFGDGGKFHHPGYWLKKCRDSNVFFKPPKFVMDV
jgi:hypothetical protein